MLRRTAVGCLDPEDDALPAGTSLERSTRDKRLALVRCQSSDESWQVTCQHGDWSLEDVGNCTTTRPQVEGTVRYHYEHLQRQHSLSIECDSVLTDWRSAPHVKRGDFFLDFSSRNSRAICGESGHWAGESLASCKLSDKLAQPDAQLA